MSEASVVPLRNVSKGEKHNDMRKSLKLRIGTILVCFVSAIFTQYQSVAPCVFVFHSTFLAFMYMEHRRWVQWISVLLVSLGLTLSMSQLFRPDEEGQPAWDWFSVGIVAGIQFAAGHLFWIFSLIHCRLSTGFENSIFILFCYPVLVVSGYVLVDMVSPVGSQGSIGYALSEWLSFVQIVSLFGLSGLNFVILSVAVSVTHVFLIDDKGRKRGVVAASIGISMFFGNWIFGSFRLASPFIYQKSVIETALPSHGWVTGACLLMRDDTSMVARTEAILAANKDISFVIWSESAAGVFYDDYNTPSREQFAAVLSIDLIEPIANLSSHYNATIAFTYSVWAVPDDPNDNSRYNMMSFMDPQKGLIANYSKHHPVPVLENFVTASNDNVVSAVSSSIGPFNAAICFDFDYPSFIRQGTDTGLLIQSANTWGIVGHFHAISSSFRAIENGAHLLRCGAMGPSGVYDIYGNSLAYQSRMDDGIVYFQIPYAAPQTWTFSSKAGFVIDYFFFAFSVIFIAVLIASARRHPKSSIISPNIV